MEAGGVMDITHQIYTVRITVRFDPSAAEKSSNADRSSKKGQLPRTPMMMVMTVDLPLSVF